METGEIKHDVDIGSHVPTGFFTGTELYDVNKFCWGVRNAFGVLASVNDGNIIYFNESDLELVEKLDPQYFNGKYVLGSGSKYFPLEK